jgi:hypothetical protein
MADGNLVRQSNVRKSAMVFGPSVYDVPLLPYERELIKTIGITEEEYQLFAAEVRQRGRLRPAEYEHIPDIKNDIAITPILINLAISLVLTGVAYLLTPKPKMPSAPKSGRIDLESITGASRFTPSRGFETLNELADYASPIPIIFGLYNEREKVGGMLIEPRLVWSRMFSHGTQQQANLLFVVGEQGIRTKSANDGIAPPSLEGIFLGNNALDVIYDDLFAFYWKRGYTEEEGGFVRKKHFQKGDEGVGNLSFGPNDEVFVCPSGAEENDPKAFCHSFSPVNNAQFGIYGAIVNGTGYRLNYQVITVPRDNINDKKQRVNIIKRIKVIGDLNLGRDGDPSKGVDPGTNASDLPEYTKIVRKQKHEGEGRQYSPRMGVVRHVRGGVDTTTSGAELTKIVDVEVNDSIIFRISNSKIPTDAYASRKDQLGEKVDDINSTVLAEQVAADAAMQKGEIFAIGNTLWKVIDRLLIEFNPESKENDDQKITLRCIDTSESLENKIGIVSLSRVINPTVYLDDRDGIGAGFFPLTQIATATVRNNRPAVVTELGIKSTVYQNLQGLCSFPGLPSSDEINEYDEGNVTVTTGTITATIARSSCFRIFIRKAGLNPSGNPRDFRAFQLRFVVVGQRPVAQYNFIRIESPRGLGPEEFEFKIVPIPGSELRALPDDAKFIKLSATIPNNDSETSLVNEPASVGNIDGVFNIIAAGSVVERSAIRANKEFTRKPSFDFTPPGLGTPSVVVVRNVLPADSAGTENQIDSVEFVGNFSNESNATAGRIGAMTYEIADNPDDSSVAVDQTITVVTKEFLNANDDLNFVIVRWTLVKRRLSSGHYAREYGGQDTVWAPAGIEVLASSGNYAPGSQLRIKRGIGGTNVPGGDSNPYQNSNPFKHDRTPNNERNLRYSGQAYRVTSVRTVEAIPGRTNGFYYQLFALENHFADSLPVGTVRTVSRTYTEGNKSIRLRYKSAVKQLASNHWSGETKAWTDPSIDIVEGNSTTSNWEINDRFGAVLSIANDNPFQTVYSLSGLRFKIAQREELPGSSTIDAEVFFEGQSQYADVSFYRSLVKKSNESEPEHEVVYVNEILPNDPIPSYNDLTMAGLSLKASRNFTQLDQLRTWIGRGIHVERLHADLNTYEPNGQSKGPSNLLTDLVFYLFTDQMGGAGGLTGMTAANPTLIEKDKLKETSKFLRKQKLFFNGVIGENVNLRQFVMDMAPNFLCNFVLTDGKFALLPAIPHVPKSGQIELGSLKISQLFTAGNILQDSLKVEYLSSEERRPFKANVRYRQETKNKFPEEKVVEIKAKRTVSYDALQTSANIERVPHEQFNLTQFCTSKEHAIKVGKYFLALRQLVTHTISFSTTVHGLDLQAGSFIKVVTESSPYSSANNGSISSTGQVTSVTPLNDGQYNVSYFQINSEDVEIGTLNVSDGVVTDSTFHNSVFTLTNPEVSQNVYVVEQLTFSQEGTVDIVASEHPCNDDGSSKLAHMMQSGPFDISPDENLSD